MNPFIRAHLSRGRGLITRPQAIGAGLSQRELTKLLRSGTWIAVRRGVYAEAAVWDGLTEYSGKPLFRARAAHLTMSKDHVLSHDSAALQLGLEILLPRPELVHVTRPGVTGSRSEHGVKHHKAPFRPDQVIEVDGIRVLNLPRTAVDIAREHGITHGVVACDSALRAGVPRRALEVTAAEMWCWPGSTRIRESIRLARPGTDTVGESLSRLLVNELDIGEPETQFGLTDGHRVAWCDLRVGRHIFEFDGRVKYRTVEDGGVANAAPDEVLWQEKTRQDFVCGFHLGMSRIVWADLWGTRRPHTLRRLRREYDATAARFGTDISDLAPYIVRRQRSA